MAYQRAFVLFDHFDMSRGDEDSPVCLRDYRHVLRLSNKRISCATGGERTGLGRGELYSEGIIAISSVFGDTDNVTTTPYRRQLENNDLDGQQHIMSGFSNSTLQIITVEQDELNIKADILPRESLRFYADPGRDYQFTFRCRRTEHSQSYVIPPYN